MEITEELIKKLEFEFKDLGDESPYEIWTKQGIEIWNYNDEYWLVDALDQGGIDVEFNTIEELNLFFVSCKKDSLIKQKVTT